MLILVGATAPLDQEALQPPPRMTSRIEEQTVPSLRSSRVQSAPANHPQNEGVALISFGFPPVASVPPLDLGIRAEVLDTGSSIRAVHEPCGSASFAFCRLGGPLQTRGPLPRDRADHFPPAQIDQGTRSGASSRPAKQLAGIRGIASLWRAWWSVGLRRDVRGADAPGTTIVNLHERVPPKLSACQVRLAWARIYR